MLDNTPNKLTKFRTKNWVEINNDLRGTYNSNSQIKSKTSMLRSSLCDYSDAYILMSQTITVAILATGREDNNVQVVSKSYAPFTNCIIEVNNTQTENVKGIDVGSNANV